ncbi:orotidine 5'-phosphate decarboxylase / HUMPS family protein [Shigella boydii]
MVVALDYHNRDDALAFSTNRPTRLSSEGRQRDVYIVWATVCRELQQRGFDIFLDLKFHDIADTAAHAVAAAAD